MGALRWACGLTTCAKRHLTTLPQTLISLRHAGFPDPWLYVDGWDKEPQRFADGLAAALTARGEGVAVKYGATFHNPRLNTFGNWILGLAELWIRNPLADRFAMFQDDVVFVRNLRPYLERCAYPYGGRATDPGNKNGYWSLYTGFDTYHNLRPRRGWQEGYVLNDGTHAQRHQRCEGALALVFNREAAAMLLTHQHLIHKPLSAGREAYRNTDGAIVSAMNRAGWRLYVHGPSLCQHIGHESSMGSGPYAPAPDFPSQSFDALSLLPVQ